jgi:hypothetical protein
MLTETGLVFLHSCLGGAEVDRQARAEAMEKRPWWVSDYTNLQQMFADLFQRRVIAATTKAGAVRLEIADGHIVGVIPKGGSKFSVYDPGSPDIAMR